VVGIARCAGAGARGGGAAPTFHSNGDEARAGMLRILWRAAKCLVEDEGLELSGHLAFTALLALFPFLILLGALAGLLGDAATGGRFVAIMLDFVPSDISATLGPAITEIFSTPERGILTFSGLFMLWTASNGVEALRVALDRAYGAGETRTFWHRRLQSLGFVAIGVVSMMLLSFTIVLSPILMKFATRFVSASTAELIFWQSSRYAIATGVTFVALLLLHRWLPNTHLKGRELLPGIIVTVALLLCNASLFSLYLAAVGRYNAVYGSLGGMVVTLIYLYVNALTFIFGAEINSVMWGLHARRP